MRCGIWSKSKMMFFGLLMQMNMNHPWLNTSQLSPDINFQDAIHVLGVVNDHRRVAALTGKTSAATARSNWHSKLVTERKCLNYILFIARPDNPNGCLTII